VHPNHDYELILLLVCKKIGLTIAKRAGGIKS
jgi:hypothetical protein